MINLSGRPSLGTLSLTRDGVRKYTYVLPRGETFPETSTGSLVITDRAGGEYSESPFAGELSPDFKSMTWLLDPAATNEIPAGANFEVFLTVNGEDYKVRYGRVVREQVEFPLNPLLTEPPPLMYEDTLQRTQPGPRWIPRYGRIAMHQPAGTVDYAMAARNNITLFGGGLGLWSAAATLWYAPTQSDTIEMSVGLCDGGDGDTTIVLCSDYSMNNFIGVRFRDAGASNGPDRINIVTGSSWNNLTVHGSGYNHLVPDDGQIYTIRYSLPTNTVSVYLGTDLTNAAIWWTDSTGIAKHGAGYRYTGAIFNSTLVDSGPQLYYWKVKDAV